MRFLLTHKISFVYFLLLGYFTLSPHPFFPPSFSSLSGDTYLFDDDIWLVLQVGLKFQSAIPDRLALVTRLPHSTRCTFQIGAARISSLAVGTKSLGDLNGLFLGP